MHRIIVIHTVYVSITKHTSKLSCSNLCAADQYKWLERDLAKVDREVTPWLIATWHPPWYSTYKAHYREAECMRVEMEELLYKYGVDIVFNGHVSVIYSLDFQPSDQHLHNFFPMVTCRYMPMRGLIEYTTTLWIHVGLFISQLVMVEIERRWQLHTLMNRGTARIHAPHQIITWAVSVPSISHQVQQLENSVGTANLIIVHTEKVALVMGFWR